MRNVLVVIPARGGSKGIPRKNLSRVGGLPLVGRAILAARGSTAATMVVVSTDDEEIADMARVYGAGVVERPFEISGDSASSESALLHAADTIRSQTGSEPEIVVLVQCTSPFVSSKEIDDTIAPLVVGDADSAFAAVPFHHFLWRRDQSGETHGVNHPGGPRSRRQDLEPQYLEAGSVYAMRTAALREVGHRFCGRSVLVETDPDRVFEIDTPNELDQARALAPVLDRQFISERLPHQISAVVFDFDGVFTANTVYTDQDGREMIRAHRGDGMGIARLRSAGIPMVVISSERNPVVEARCAKLELPVFHGVADKKTLLSSWLAERSLSPQDAVYVGNDLNDLDCMEMVGCSVAPADSHPQVIAQADIILPKSGGLGAVRELTDAILSR